MTKYHGRLSPKQVLRALDEFSTAINQASDQAVKDSLFNSAWRFAIAEARKNDKFPHVKFIERLGERTGMSAERVLNA